MASVASLAFESPLSFSDRVAQLLDRIDCRPAGSEEEREAIFRLRYQAYLREVAIGPNFSGTFCDLTMTRKMRGCSAFISKALHLRRAAHVGRPRSAACAIPVSDGRRRASRPSRRLGTIAIESSIIEIC